MAAEKIERAFREEPDRYTRGDILDEGVPMYIRSGFVGEAVATDAGPKILYVAMAGEVVDFLPNRNGVVLSPRTSLQQLNRSSLATQKYFRHRVDGNRRRIQQIEGLAMQSGSEQVVTYALHELSTDEDPVVPVMPVHLGQWIGLTTPTITDQYRKLSLDGAIEDTTPHKVVVNREILAKKIAFPRPIR